MPGFRAYYEEGMVVIVYDLVARLLMLINSTDKHAPEYHIAYNLLQCLREIPHLRIEAAAKRCLTSPATLSRFCTRLGYSNYTVFRKAVQQEMDAIEDENRIKSDILDYPASALAPAVLDSTVLTLRAFRSVIDIEQIKKAAADLLCAKERIIMGPDAVQPAVLDFQMKMFLCGYTVTYQKGIDQAKEDLGPLSKDALLIYLFPVRRLLSSNLNLVKQTSTLLKTPCKKVFITVSPELQVYQPDASCILLPDIADKFNAHTNSILALQCALEMLFITFYQLQLRQKDGAGNAANCEKPVSTGCETPG